MQMLQLVECKLAKHRANCDALGAGNSNNKAAVRERPGFLRDGISFADIRDLELSRIQRRRKGRGVFCLLEVDGDLVQIGPN